jgi:hypothetical protein
MQAVIIGITNGIGWKLNDKALVLVKHFETEIVTQFLVYPSTITHPILLSGSNAGKV